ncbi:MAG TPA: hypothetical protein VMW50_00990 [Dehalococcoidia bacterium]|nr:hypothetical protein [Dehalococcoidia bacterium]
MIDLEGTLSDHTARLATLLNATKDDVRHRPSWKEYYKGLIYDEPRPHMMELVQEWIENDFRPLVYSTRFVNKYNHEEEWLKIHSLFGKVDLIQRHPTQTQIKGPDLVVQWVKEYRPEIIVDDRDEVRDKIRGIGLPGLLIYGPNAFLPDEGNAHGHSLR